MLAAFRQQTGGQKTLAEYGKDLISSWLRLRAETYYDTKTRLNVIIISSVYYYLLIWSENRAWSLTAYQV